MPRRGGKRKNDFDDSLERSYMMSKRPRSEYRENAGVTSHDQEKREAPREKSTKKQDDDTRSTAEQTHSNPEQQEKEMTKLDRLREKKRLRKFQKKAKAEERRQQEQVRREEQEKQKQVVEKQKKKALKERAKLKQKSSKPDGQLITARKGVQYQDIIIGTGPEVRMGKQIQVKYTLRSAPGKGKVIDSSHNFGTRLGRGEVIEGWDIGLKGMKKGGLRHLIIPPQAGYGQQNIGAGKGALLYFEIKILAC